MEPGFKTILEGQIGDIKVIAQALKAEVLFFFHRVNVLKFWRKSKNEIAIDSDKGLMGSQCQQD
jgi:hypothetical protein